MQLARMLAYSCYLNGKWLEWQEWSTCTKECDTGERTRKRICEKPQYGGKTCPGPDTATETCNTQECPVNGKWSEWQDWSPCTKDCDTGERTRKRTCQEPQHGGVSCPGSDSATETCNTQECPVNGQWLDWQEWSTCTKECGTGERTRKRTCQEPQHGGDACPGSDSATETCNTQECPSPVQWYPWGAWGGCDKTCAGGQRKRTRICGAVNKDGPPPPDTAKCPGSGEDITTCNTFECDPLPKTCSDLVKRGAKESGEFILLPPIIGSQASRTPAHVYCDMDAEGGVGVTIINHTFNKPKLIKGTEVCIKHALIYPGMTEIYTMISIIRESANCKQFLSWKCRNSAMTATLNTNKLTYFFTRSNKQADYWGNATGKNCECGMTGTCYKTGTACNCDANDDVWREDSGSVTNKDDLPITAVCPGNTGRIEEEGYIFVGPLLCWGTSST